MVLDISNRLEVINIRESVNDLVNELCKTNDRLGFEIKDITESKSVNSGLIDMSFTILFESFGSMEVSILRKGAIMKVSCRYISRRGSKNEGSDTFRWDCQIDEINTFIMEVRLGGDIYDK